MDVDSSVFCNCTTWKASLFPMTHLLYKYASQARLMPYIFSTKASYFSLVFQLEVKIEEIFNGLTKCRKWRLYWWYA